MIDKLQLPMAGGMYGLVMNLIMFKGYTSKTVPFNEFFESKVDRDKFFRENMSTMLVHNIDDVVFRLQMKLVTDAHKKLHARCMDGIKYLVNNPDKELEFYCETILLLDRFVDRILLLLDDVDDLRKDYDKIKSFCTTWMDTLELSSLNTVDFTPKTPKPSDDSLPPMMA